MCSACTKHWTRSPRSPRSSATSSNCITSAAWSSPRSPPCSRCPSAPSTGNGSAHAHSCTRSWSEAPVDRKRLVEGTSGGRGGRRRHTRFSRDWSSDVALPICVHEALDALAEIAPQQRDIVELHYFGGLEFAEIAAVLEVSERTVYRQWQRARAFLHAQLE